MRIVRATECRVMPWKNGGGSTTELAVSPAHATFDTFDWRISMAKVSTGGPFSSFGGVDRSITIVGGNALILRVGSDAPVTLAVGSEPFSFQGELKTCASLPSGEITDLNVMTRRGRFNHRMMRIEQPQSAEFAEEEDIVVVVALNGSATVSSGQGICHLDHGDAVIMTRESEPEFQVMPSAPCRCYLVFLSQCRGEDA
jgi:uncharacterized protein